MTHHFDHLHPRQQAIVRHIQSFSAAHGYPPTLREICQALGFPSTCIPAYHVDRLIEFGWLEKDKHAARALRVIRRPPNSVQVADPELSIHLEIAAHETDALSQARDAIETLQGFIAQLEQETL